MKLYRFTIGYYYRYPRFTIEELEVKEKKYIYVTNGHRIFKSDIGTVSGKFNDTCILLENNPQKAAAILKEAKEKEMEIIKSQMKKKQEELELLEERRLSSILFWTDLSYEAKSVIEWIENPYTTCRETISISIGKYFNPTDYYTDCKDASILITPKLFLEILAWVKTDSEITYKLSDDGTELKFWIRNDSELKLH